MKMKMKAMPIPSCCSIGRFTIWAYTKTSRAEAVSSAMICET